MNNLVRQNESPKQPASSHSERQGKTWHSLTEIYGARWIRDNGEAPGRVWCSMLNALTDTEIGTALATLVKSPRKDGRGNIHPPSAPEFWEAAKAQSPRTSPALTDQRPDCSKYGSAGNRVLMYIVMSERGLGNEIMKLMVKEKDRLIADYELMASDGIDINWSEFISVIDESLKKKLTELRLA